MARVMIYVQHLLGVGHARRATLIGRALAEDGAQVTLVSGGMPVPGLDIRGIALRQLPPARAGDESFAALVDEQGRVVDDAWREMRRERLLEAFRQVRPEVLITEHFPFGRRQLRFELLPLLRLAREARPRPWVVCSVRDILVEASEPARYEEMVALANAHFHRVLVHGDEQLIPFRRSFPLAGRLSPEVIQTGYVVEAGGARTGMTGTQSLPAPLPSGASLSSGAALLSGVALPPGEVLVAGGSRGRGVPLVEAALAARPLSVLANHPWRILTGLNFPPGRLEELRARAGPGVTVEPFREDYRELLGRAALSISQGGYNTTMEVIAAGVPAVLAPHAAENDGEQALRARLLSERGAVTLVKTLDAEGLARAVDDAVAGETLRDAGVDMGGAVATGRLIAELLRKGPAPATGRP